jgi:hypothetical protein
VYHKIRFWNCDVQGFTGVADSLDTVHINLPWKAKNGKIIPGRFDMVLLKEIANISGVRGLLLSWLLLCLLIHCDQVFVWPKSVWFLPSPQRQYHIVYLPALQCQGTWRMWNASDHSPLHLILIMECIVFHDQLIKSKTLLLYLFLIFSAAPIYFQSLAPLHHVNGQAQQC